MGSRSALKNTARARAAKAPGANTPSKPDPIFARIEAHRAAEAAFNRAIDVENAVEARVEKQLRSCLRFDDAFIHVGAQLRRITTDKDLRELQAGLLQDFIGRFSFNGKVRHAALIKKAVAGNVTRLRHELTKARARVERVRERSGWNKAHDEWQRACDASRTALEKLITTQPTTPEGLAAFIDYLNEAANRDQLDGLDHDWLANVFTTIAKANVRARRAK